MSIQVKTPTKTQFAGLEIQCGDKRLSQGDGVKKCKDDIQVNAKFSQPWNRQKRRYSQSYRREESGNPMRRKRIKSAYFEKPLPNRFLNGGSIDDPLALNSLESTELGKQLNSVTPQSSPLPTPKRQSVQVRIPVNVTDPLNLNESYETKVQKISKKKRHRHRHKKKDDSAVGPALFSPPKNVAKDKNLMEALRIDIEPEVQNAACHKESVVLSKPRAVCDQIVSPVIRQTTPKHNKRRRTNSEGKPEPSAAASRSLLASSSTSSPKKFKQPKQIGKGKGNKSMQGGQVKFIYGNYNRYYGYRNPAMETDHRIKSFSKDWFECKCVLDIGCNVGHLTLAIAKEFNPSKVTGIDIDHKLITAARKNIRYYISSSTTNVSKYPISNLLNYGPIEAPPVRQKGQTAFPHNVMFMQGNYVLEHDELLDIQREEYDVILALSISKWIHFNWGDPGLKRFFKRVFKQLRPGGMFILEPQPWSSYKKKKKLSDAIFKNFQEIRLRPEQFNDYLLSKEVGFSTCKTVDVPLNKSKGFRRPIMVFKKSETVQNSPRSECGRATSARCTEHAQNFTPPRRTESMVSMATSVATSDRTSEYSSCSTCSCSSCCSESQIKRDQDIDIEMTEVKVRDDIWNSERSEEVVDSARDKSAESSVSATMLESPTSVPTDMLTSESDVNMSVGTDIAESSVSATVLEFPLPVPTDIFTSVPDVKMSVGSDVGDSSKVVETVDSPEPDLGKSNDNKMSNDVDKMEIEVAKDNKQGLSKKNNGAEAVEEIDKLKIVIATDKVETIREADDQVEIVLETGKVEIVIESPKVQQVIEAEKGKIVIETDKVKTVIETEKVDTDKKMKVDNVPETDKETDKLEPVRKTDIVQPVEETEKVLPVGETDKEKPVRDIDKEASTAIDKPETEML